MLDVSHIGELCKAIREQHTIRGSTAKLTLKEIGQRCNITEGALSKFEKHGRLGELSFERYLQLLQEELGLSSSVGKRLESLRLASKPKNRRTSEETISNFSFDYIKRQTEFIKALRQEKRPSYIMDGLWFVHAMNSPLLRLFNIDNAPSKVLLRQWEAWHLLSTKYVPDSPVRKAHPERYHPGYFPPSCQMFYQVIGRGYLFTTQMREFLRRLQLISPEFEKLWPTIVTFTHSYSEELERVLTYTDSRGATYEIQTTVYLRELPEVEFMPGYSMNYIQVTWRPKDERAERAFEEISRVASRQPGSYEYEVSFASDYIPDYSGWKYEES